MYLRKIKYSAASDNIDTFDKRVKHGQQAKGQNGTKNNAIRDDAMICYC